MRAADEIDEQIRAGYVECFRDDAGVERVRLTPKGYRDWAYTLRSRGEPAPFYLGASYAITRHADGHESIDCFACRHISHNPNDVRERYCPHCHAYHPAG